jgi:hypothetical protein
MSINRKFNAQTESGTISDRSHQGQSLLMEWSQGDGSLSRFPRKEVTFSEYSELTIYDNKRYLNESYSSADRKRFQSRAARNACRIHNLVSSSNLSTGAVIHHAIQQGLLQKEQLVGIEDLVMGEKAFEEMRRQRMVHVTSVLKAQKLMQERNSNGVDTAMLAKVASMSSSKSVKKAWLRAVWSLIFVCLVTFL